MNYFHVQYNIYYELTAGIFNLILLLMLLSKFRGRELSHVIFIRVVSILMLANFFEVATIVVTRATFGQPQWLINLMNSVTFVLALLLSCEAFFYILSKVGTTSHGRGNWLYWLYVFCKVYGRSQRVFCLAETCFYRVRIVSRILQRLYSRVPKRFQTAIQHQCSALFDIRKTIVFRSDLQGLTNPGNTVTFSYQIIEKNVSAAEIEIINSDEFALIVHKDV